MDLKEAAEYQRVAEANRLFYREVARLYDSTETCITSPRFQNQLRESLKEILGLISKPAQEVSALDACGGTGNVALNLARLGVPAELSDISSEQLAIYHEKCAAAGLEPRTFQGEISQFLRSNPAKYDLIVFSSALHHLQDYTYVLSLAFDALAPGGLIFTLYDPTPAGARKRSTRIFLAADYLVFKFTAQLGDVPAGIARKIKRRLRRGAAAGAEGGSDETPFLAEYHMLSGIDDHKLAEHMKELGAEVVWHRRIPGGRHAFTRKLIGLFGDATDFELLLRKPAS